MVDADLETAVDNRRELEKRREVVASRVAQRQQALVQAFRMLYDELSTHRGCSSLEATELFEELDDLDAQFQAAV